MIDFETFQKIKFYHSQQGLNVAQIAQQLNLDSRTIAYWVHQPNYRPRKSGTTPLNRGRFRFLFLEELCSLAALSSSTDDLLTLPP